MFVEKQQFYKKKNIKLFQDVLFQFLVHKLHRLGTKDKTSACNNKKVILENKI